MLLDNDLRKGIEPAYLVIFFSLLKLYDFHSTSCNRQWNGVLDTIMKKVGHVCLRLNNLLVINFTPHPPHHARGFGCYFLK